MSAQRQVTPKTFMPHRISVMDDLKLSILGAIRLQLYRNRRYRGGASWSTEVALPRHALPEGGQPSFHPAPAHDLP